MAEQSCIVLLLSREASIQNICSSCEYGGGENFIQFSEISAQVICLEVFLSRNIDVVLNCTLS